MPRSVAPERMAKMKKGYEEYLTAKANQDKNVDLRSLSKKYSISTSALNQQFQRWDAIEAGKRLGKGKGGDDSSVEELTAEETAREGVLKAVKKETTRIVDLSLALGTLLVNRYRPLLEVFEIRGKGGPQEIVTEIMGWYESKAEVEKSLHMKDFANLVLKEKIKELAKHARPTYWAEIKAKLFYKYAQDLLVAKSRGLSINTKRALRAFNEELDIYEDQLNKELQESTLS